MVGGPIFARKTLSCLASETCHTRQRLCLPPLAPRRAAAGHSRSKQLVSTSQLRVAQQFGDTLTDVNTKPGQSQEQLSQDDQLLRAAVEEAVPVVSGYALCVALAHCAGDLLSNTVHLSFCGTYAPAYLNNSLAKDMLPRLSRSLHPLPLCRKCLQMC